LSVRLPTAEWYVAAVAKEHTWLPRLAPHLPLPIPVPVALGAPGAGYPWPWSVRRWIEGRPTADDRIADPVAFADDLARFLMALWGVDSAGGPAAGAHSFHRGGALTVYDAETRAALDALGPRVDRAAATQMWEAALASPFTGLPVWFHGDVAVGNLLVDAAGRLSAVIDFGTSGVGDPACDLVIAWTLFDGAARARFVGAVGQDPDTWARARGWALWKALITLAALDAEHRHAKGARKTLDRLFRCG
jgi:aminoglycoside phosphotransferase (APT) family kinase protein